METLGHAVDVVPLGGVPVKLFDTVLGALVTLNGSYSALFHSI